MSSNRRWCFNANGPLVKIRLIARSEWDMKIAFLVTVLPLLLVGAVDGQTPSQRPGHRGTLMSAGEDAYHASLKLTTSIVDEHYCSDGRIRYSLLFKFTNMGNQPVILNRLRPEVARYMISANQKAAVSRNHETVAHIMVGLNNENMSSTAELNEKHFLFLKTGEVYEVKDSLTISPRHENGKRLRSGTHMLQVVVQTWPNPGASNVEWREKWRNRGYLWSDSLISDPMPFVIKKQPLVLKCD